MKTLTLHLKKKWFEQVESGEKLYEYRLYNEYWRKRIEGVHFALLELALGFPKKEDLSRRIVMEYIKPSIITISHEEWDLKTKEVFCFPLAVENYKRSDK